MSVCLDGFGEMKECPCFDTYAWNETSWYVCNLNAFVQRKQSEGLPDTCPYAPILKLLAEAVEIKEFETWEGLMRLDENGNDLNEGWQKVEFWIRREGER